MEKIIELKLLNDLKRRHDVLEIRIMNINRYVCESGSGFVNCLILF